MRSIVHITGQLNTECTYQHPQAVFHKIERGEPVPLGEPDERMGLSARDHDRRVGGGAG
jgi:hypothetical protein